MPGGVNFVASSLKLATNANGAPIDEKHFWPIYEVIEKSGRPILLHPSRTRQMPDYPTETYSKYEICSVLGWPYETGVTLSRFVFSGIMDRYPDLKIISHHLGGVIPYLEGRVAHSFDFAIFADRQQILDPIRARQPHHIPHGAIDVIA